jgi:DNA replication protein DnaC
LLLHGGAGGGKTCAALCVLDYADDWGPVYWTVPMLCEEIIRCQQGRMENAAGYKVCVADFWRQMAARSLVVLDELGCRERVTDFHYEAVKQTIDARYAKPLICISNLPLSQLQRVYDERIASRLEAGTVIELVSEDRRLRA